MSLSRFRPRGTLRRSHVKADARNSSPASRAIGATRKRKASPKPEASTKRHPLMGSPILVRLYGYMENAVIRLIRELLPFRGQPQPIGLDFWRGRLLRKCVALTRIPEIFVTRLRSRLPRGASSGPKISNPGPTSPRSLSGNPQGPDGALPLAWPRTSISVGVAIALAVRSSAASAPRQHWRLPLLSFLVWSILGARPLESHNETAHIDRRFGRTVVLRIPSHGRSTSPCFCCSCRQGWRRALCAACRHLPPRTAKTECHSRRAKRRLAVTSGRRRQADRSPSRLSAGQTRLGACRQLLGPRRRFLHRPRSPICCYDAACPIKILARSPPCLPS